MALISVKMYTLARPLPRDAATIGARISIWQCFVLVKLMGVGSSHCDLGFEKLDRFKTKTPRNESSDFPEWNCRRRHKNQKQTNLESSCYCEVILGQVRHSGKSQ